MFKNIVVCVTGSLRKGKYDLEIKYFLDIEVDEEAFDFTTIWKFKKMLGEEKVKSIFNHILISMY